MSAVSTLSRRAAPPAAARAGASSVGSIAQRRDAGRRAAFTSAAARRVAVAPGAGAIGGDAEPAACSSSAPIGDAAAVGRRALLAAAMAVAAVAGAAPQARADGMAAGAPLPLLPGLPDGTTAVVKPGAAPGTLLYQDLEFELALPADFSYVEVAAAPRRTDIGGPSPERSPVRGRFDSGDHAVVVSVVTRPAASLKPMLMQVTDVSIFGPPVEAAQLLLPPGSVVSASRAVVVEAPARDTSLGLVAPPPRSYYLYEFSTPNGLRVVMSAAARKGRIYVCGASAPADAWATQAERMRGIASSFRLKGGTVLM
jgi:hypothetical protein